MDATKLTDSLQSHLAIAAADALLEIVVELPAGAAPPAGGSRRERIAAQRQTFEAEVGPVESAVQGLGGEVTERAWLNRTLRARVPAAEVGALSEHGQVARLDLPRAIAPETPIGRPPTGAE